MLASNLCSLNVWSCRHVRWSTSHLVRTVSLVLLLFSCNCQYAVFKALDVSLNWYILVWLWNQTQIRSWNQLVLSNDSKVPCLTKQWEPLIGFKLTIVRHPLIVSQDALTTAPCNTTPFTLFLHKHCKNVSTSGDGTTYLIYAQLSYLLPILMKIM